MEKQYVSVISNCGQNGMLWPRMIFMNAQRIPIKKVFHSLTRKPQKPEGPASYSYRCQINGRNMNIAFEGETGKWFLTPQERRLYF